MSGGMAWTIRCDSLELWPGLVLHGMGEVDVHVFWKYWKLASSPNTSKFVFGPPDWSSDCFESQGSISGAIKPINFPKNDHQKENPEPGKPSNIIICLINWLPFLCSFLRPMPFSCLFELKCPLGPSKGSPGCEIQSSLLSPIGPPLR